MEDFNNIAFNDIKKYFERTALSIYNENRNTLFDNSYFEEYSYNEIINVNKINEMLLNKIEDLVFIRTGITNCSEFYYYYHYKGEYYKLLYLFNHNNENPFSIIDIAIYSKID
jgi:hypothetical protein